MSRWIRRASYAVVTIAIVATIALVIRWYLKASLVWVGPDEVGVLIANEGADPPPGQALAGPGEKGVRAEVLGPGRHWIRPGSEEVRIFPIVHVHSGSDGRIENGAPVPPTLPEVGIVTSLVGKTVSDGRFLAEPGERGIQRRVLTPGKYRLNPFAYEVKMAPVTVVDAGYVGVLTRLGETLSLTDATRADARGVQDQVLPPGVYFLNPYEYRVTKLRVGYQELAFDEQTAITFPTADGNTVRVGATAVWGLRPDDAPHLVKQFGSEAAIVTNVIRPQIESKVRVAGSNYSSRQLLEGESRGRFQEEVVRKLKEELEEKHIRILFALIRDVEIPDVVRKPMQSAKVAEEEEQTNRVKSETAKLRAEVNALRGEVEIEGSRVRAETARLVQEEMARGKSEVSRVYAESKLKAAESLAESARLRGEARKQLGKANADVASRWSLVAAEGLRARTAPFANPDDYALWRFAEGLPADLRVELRYAGPGTLWTDAKNLDISGAISKESGSAPMRP